MAEERIVSITVREKAEQKDGWKVTGDVAQFSTKFPVVFTRVSESEAGLVKPGGIYNVKLVRGRSKKDDPRYETDYWWEWGGVTKEAAPAPVNGDDRQRRIQVQWAIGRATELVGASFGAATQAWASRQKDFMDAIEELAPQFLSMADRLLAQNSRPESTETPPSSPPSGIPQNEDEKAPAEEGPSLKRFGDLYNACLKDFKVGKPKVLEILGVKNDALIADLDDAYAKVKAWAQEQSGSE